MIKSYLRCGYNCTRKALICLALIGIGYLLGNAFPTFEVVPYGYKAFKGNPLSLSLEECAPVCEDFNDEVK